MLSRKPDVLSDASVSSKSKIRAMTSDMELGDKDEWKRNGGRERTQTDGAKKRTAAILPECGGGCARRCLWVLLAGIACRCCLRFGHERAASSGMGAGMGCTCA